MWKKCVKAINRKISKLNAKNTIKSQPASDEEDDE